MKCPRCHAHLRRSPARKFCEACGAKVPRRRIVRTFVVIVTVWFTMAFIAHLSNRRPALLVRIDEAGNVLKQADKLWDAGKHPEAVQTYKRFLRLEEHYQFRRELPAAYRRVIEFEIEQGRAGEARDWMLLAWNEWPGQPMQLSFQSEKAEMLWREIVGLHRADMPSSR